MQIQRFFKPESYLGVDQYAVALDDACAIALGLRSASAFVTRDNHTNSRSIVREYLVEEHYVSDPFCKLE